MSVLGVGGVVSDNRRASFQSFRRHKSRAVRLPRYGGAGTVDRGVCAVYMWFIQFKVKCSEQSCRIFNNQACVPPFSMAREARWGGRYFG